MPSALEEEITRRHEREHDWIEHHPDGEPMFEDTRVCDHCAAEGQQKDMRWTGKRWLCPEHYDEMSLN